MKEMPITKKGFWFIVAGVVTMLAGYMLMSGGGSDDPQVFNYAMFNFRRIVAAPLLILAGVVVVGVGIMGPGCRRGHRAGTARGRP